jgi:hypothetical protein
LDRFLKYSLEMAYSLLISGFLNITVLMLWLSPASAQHKYEREYSIKGAQVHPDALSFMNECFKNVKIHWYGEESLNGTTIEAKLKSAGKQYSIEFSDSGEIHDIEILTTLNALPGDTKAVLLKQLNEEFRNYKVVKTQIQWSGERDLLKAALLNDEFPGGVLIQYELIIRAKKTDLSKYYEVLCDQSGKTKSVREIIQRNVDNLIY